MPCLPETTFMIAPPAKEIESDVALARLGEAILTQSQFIDER
jgi:hypothetical protein